MPHLKWLQCYHVNEIMPTQWNIQTYVQRAAKILAYMVVHARRYASRTTVWFVDTHTHTQTR